MTFDICAKWGGGKAVGLFAVWKEAVITEMGWQRPCGVLKPECGCSLKSCHFTYKEYLICYVLLGVSHKSLSAS